MSIRSCPCIEVIYDPSKGSNHLKLVARHQNLGRRTSGGGQPPEYTEELQRRWGCMHKEQVKGAYPQGKIETYALGIPLSCATACQNCVLPACGGSCVQISTDDQRARISIQGTVTTCLTLCDFLLLSMSHLIQIKMARR